MTRNLDFIAHVRVDELGRDAKSQILAQSRLVFIIVCQGLLTRFLRASQSGATSLSSAALFTFVHAHLGFYFLCNTLLQFRFSIYFPVLRTCNFNFFLFEIRFHVILK